MSTCPNILDDTLNPRMTWENAGRENYDEKAQFLANKFNENFKKYKELCKR